MNKNEIVCIAYVFNKSMIFFSSVDRFLRAAAFRLCYVQMVYITVVVVVYFPSSSSSFACSSCLEIN